MFIDGNKVMVLENDKILKDDFKDDFEALEWLTLNMGVGKFTIRIEHVIIL
jgi:hypothetical protein